jgi:hypothetical protein
VSLSRRTKSGLWKRRLTIDIGESLLLGCGSIDIVDSTVSWIIECLPLPRIVEEAIALEQILELVGWLVGRGTQGSLHVELAQGDWTEKAYERDEKQHRE